jgi:3-phosphoshikimate 1-carboxyvinyltransferase
LTPLVSEPVAELSGVARAPGDKSISHRALMLAASAVGESTLHGLLEADDVLSTAAALGELGADIVRNEDGTWRVWGVGIGGFGEPDRVLELGNSGTGVRLLMGLVASQPITCFFAGDASLSARPMGRVIKPLEAVGARVLARGGRHLPLAVVGAAAPLPTTYRLPVASAQVKSAVLFAGLNAPGETTVVEPLPTRDHSERMLGHFGAVVRIGADDGARTVTVTGEPELEGRALHIPGDPSSAAFPVVAATCAADAEVTIENVCVNPTRTGLLESLAEMGAQIERLGERESDGEPVADLRVRAGRLSGIDVPPERAPSMIDEYPVLAVAAACAEGETVMRGLGELRHKESDRLAAIARGLEACGVGVEELEDGLKIRGCGGPPPGGGTVASLGDHRIAMSFLIMGGIARERVTVDDCRAIATSFPTFVECMNDLGARIAAPA